MRKPFFDFFRFAGVAVAALLAMSAAADFPFRIALAHGTRHSKPDYPGDGYDQYDDHFKNAGWPSPIAKYPSTKEGMEKLCSQLPNYDVVILSTLFNWSDGKDNGSTIDLTPYASVFRTWLEKGGALFFMDAMYDQSRSWLTAINPSLKLASEGNCRNLFVPVQPVHPLLSFPNLRLAIGGWGHLLIPENSAWQPVCGCCGGRAATVAFAKLGKGTIYVTSALEGGHWGTLEGLENFLAFLRTEGALAMDTSAVPLIPPFVTGKANAYALPAVSNRTDKTIDAMFRYRLQAEGRTQTFETTVSIPPFATKRPELVCDIPMRGPAFVLCTLAVNGKAIAPHGKSFTLPPLFRVTGPKYRGYFSADRAETAGVEVVPYEGSFRGLSCRLTVSGSGADSTFAVTSRYARIPLTLDFRQLGATRSATLRGELTQDGKKIAESEVAVSLPQPSGHAFSIADDLCILKDNKPFFPLGLYHIDPKDVAAIAALGFNMVQVFSWQNISVLDAAQANGMSVVMEMHPQHNAQGIRAYMMGKYVNHPALGFWYVADEPSLDMSDPLAKYAAYLTDTKHPAWIVSCNPSEYALHATACDILALDCYPIRNGEATRPISCIARMTDLGREAVREDKPILFILPSFGKEPEDMMRNMAYQAVIHGASGLFWYAWDEGGSSGAKHDPVTQGILKRICGEMKTLAPFLTSRKKRILAIAGDVHALTGNGLDGKSYVLLANLSDHAVEATFNLPGMETLVPLFGGEKLSVRNGKLSLDLERYGIRAFIGE